MQKRSLKLLWASQHTCCSLRGKTGFPYNQEINESGTRGRHAAFFSSRSEGALWDLCIEFCGLKLQNANYL